MAAAWVISLALATVSIVQAQNSQCKTKMFGQFTSSPLPLQPVPLQPPSADWDIKIPTVCDNVGLLVKVCDPDGPPAPTVRSLSIHEVVVQRHANLLIQAAVVYATVYCRNSRRNNNNNDDFKTTIVAVPRP